MHRLVLKSGALALGSGASVYLYHRVHRQRRLLALHRDDAQTLSWEYCPPEPLVGRAKVPDTSAKDGPLVLQLQQVQVMFRHGARTPMHTVPKVQEVAYPEQFLIRGHQESMFPYVRMSCMDESIPPWSEYEMNLWESPLRGGALPGQLTAYGKEQMYMLGLALRDCYMTRLDIATYDPMEVRVMSSNLRRTVESAQSVLAGFYGKEQLNDYAECCGPVRIFISDPCYNIMVANTDICGVLKKNSCSTLTQACFMPDFKEKRALLEEHIVKPREPHLEAVTEAQAKLDLMTQFYETEGTRTRRLEVNKHRQFYLHDPLMQPLYDERSQAIAKVDRFWTNILNREPSLRDVITQKDMKALVYLRNLEVEQFEGTLVSGYRIHLYFDNNNPYFYNTHLCKEVYTDINPEAPPSTETAIKWKPGMEKLIMEEPCTRKVDTPKCLPKCPPKPRCKAPTPCSGLCKSKPKPPPEPAQSFFLWYTEPTAHDSDTVGPAILGDVWKNPQSLLEGFEWVKMILTKYKTTGYKLHIARSRSNAEIAKN